MCFIFLCNRVEMQTVWPVTQCFQKAPGVLGSGWATPPAPTPGFQDADPPIRCYQAGLAARDVAEDALFLGACVM